MRGKPLPLQNDQELLTQVLGHEEVEYSYKDVQAELERRSANRRADAESVLSVVSVIIALLMRIRAMSSTPSLRRDPRPA